MVDHCISHFFNLSFSSSIPLTVQCSREGILWAVSQSTGIGSGVLKVCQQSCLKNTGNCAKCFRSSSSLSAPFLVSAPSNRKLVAYLFRLLLLISRLLRLLLLLLFSIRQKLIKPAHWSMMIKLPVRTDRKAFKACVNFLVFCLSLSTDFRYVVQLATETGLPFLTMWNVDAMTFPDWNQTTWHSNTSKGICR